MSIDTLVYLYCDFEGCQWSERPIFDIGEETAKQVRKLAKEMGWVRRGGKDYCSDHAQVSGKPGGGP